MARSREAILASVRRVGGSVRSLPDFVQDRPEPDDLAALFAERLADAGGTCSRVEGADAVGDALRGLPAVAQATRIASGVAALPARYADAAPVVPRDLAGFDVAVSAGAPAVAESGAVWVVPPDVLSRGALFLAEHVVLVVPRSALVHTLHDAYARLEPRLPRFGCFIAGPSKTADIEQALVIGAQGPRSLHVLLYGDDA